MIRSLLVAAAVTSMFASVAGSAYAQTRESPIVVGGEVKEPKRTKTVVPAYPADAASGTIGMQVLVNPEGRVDTVTARNDVPRATAAAVAAVRQWEYEPVLHDGKPAWFRILILVPSPWRE